MTKEDFSKIVPLSVVYLSVSCGEVETSDSWKGIQARAAVRSLNSQTGGAFAEVNVRPVEREVLSIRFTVVNP